METRMMVEEMATWTLFGRQRALKHLAQWIPGPDPDPEDWYEHRIRTYDWEADKILTSMVEN